MNKETIAFIGGGNMSRSLIGGLLMDGFEAQHLWVSNPTLDKIQSLHEQYGVNITQDNKYAAKQADLVVFAVKPNKVSEVALELATTIQQRRSLVISVALGVRIKQYQQWLGSKVPIVRAMPNTPALVGSGATGLYAGERVNEEQCEQAESLMRAVGVTVWVDKENHLDIVSVLSGSGPAYFFYLIEALEAGAVAQGLPANKANILAIQTALGAAHLALKADSDCGTLRQNVTSPGGATAAAIAKLQTRNFSDIIAEAMQAGRRRTLEITSKEQ